MGVRQSPSRTSSLYIEKGFTKLSCKMMFRCSVSLSITSVSLLCESGSLSDDAATAPVRSESPALHSLAVA